MSDNNFIDRFSRRSDIYASARPDYPKEIFSFLADIVPSNDTVWDCATGNGQAAIVLAEHFNKIYATDASEQQLENARPHERVAYSHATAEQSNLPDKSIDLITVATAAHWFDLDKFYAEAKRVLKPGGIIAMWAYCRFQTENGPINNIMDKIGREVLKDYWDPHLDKIWAGYDTWPFPFEDVGHPEWIIETNWNRDEFMAYVSTWSATNNYINKHGETPLLQIQQDLLEQWPDEDMKVKFSTNLTSRVGQL